MGFFLQAVADVMLMMVRWIIMLAPIGVFALALPLAANAGAGLAGAIGLYILVYCVGCVAVILLLYSDRRDLLAGCAAAPMIARACLSAPADQAFTSSSSIADKLPALVEAAGRRTGTGLGLPTTVTGFVLPLAVSTFKIAAPVSWTIGALFIGWFYGVPLHAPQLATVAFAAVFLAFGVPGIPRGGLHHADAALSRDRTPR